jgi:hypothetical protein
MRPVHARATRARRVRRRHLDALPHYGRLTPHAVPLGLSVKARAASWAFHGETQNAETNPKVARAGGCGAREGS